MGVSISERPIHLDYRRIAESLSSVAPSLPALDQALGEKRDSMDRQVIANMLAGYALVERLVNQRTELLAAGNAHYLLELNHLVLCGADAVRRAEFRRHLEASERRFYEHRHAGVDDIAECWKSLRGRPVWDRAAGICVRILARPQLFIEGNQRTGALIASWILLAYSQPPFVLTPANAPAWFRPASAVRDIGKSTLRGVLRLPRFQKQFAQLMRDSANRHFLAGEDPPATRPDNTLTSDLPR